MDYQKFLNESLIDFVKKIPTKVQNEGLVGKHHFYITFVTDDEDVVLTTRMKKLYPKEITIVLQNQYEDLVVKADKFSVRLSFDNISEVIEVPFKCLTNFADPSVNFNLQFKNSFVNKMFIFQDNKSDKTLKVNKKVDQAEVEEAPNNIILLDKFRNKKKPQ